MALDSTVTYPFDPTGKLASNKITGEQQIITSVSFRDYHFVVPALAPFFADSMVVKFKGIDGVVKTLVEGIDYYLTHWFIAASRACASDIYGSISFLDTTLAGVIYLDYQTIGGDWTIDATKIAEILADKLNNPRTTAWDQVVDMVVTFPVIDHEWDLVDMVGETELVDAIAGVEDMLRQTGQTGLADHLADLNNPHQVTKAQVGLGNVRNLATASNTDAVAGTSSDLYMTPASTLAVITDKAINPLTGHKANTSNPHQVTAAQVGAYSIAEMDALLLTKLNTNGVAYDTARFDGKSPSEYSDWVLAQTAANSLEFNGMTAGQYKDWILSQISPDQAGGYTAAQIDSMLAQKLDVTAQAADTAKVNGMLPDAYKAYVLAGTAANSTKFNNRLDTEFRDWLYAQMTAGTVGAYSTAEIDTLLANKLDKTAQAADSALFDSMNSTDFKAFVLTGKAADSALFGGLTPADFTTQVLLGTIANSNKFDGKTYTEMLTELDARYASNASSGSDFRHFTDAYNATSGVVELWTKLGMFTTPDPTAVAVDLPDLQWLVAGTDTADALNAALFYLRCSVRGPNFQLRNISEVDTGAQFGYTSVATATAGVNEITIWVKTGNNKNPITVTELAKGVGTIYDSTTEPQPHDVEPTGIVYLTPADPYLTTTAAAATYATQTDVEAAFDALNQAFQDLKASISA